MRKIIIILTSCLVLLLLGYTGYRSYLVWKQSHGISMAKAFFAKSDIRNGALSVQQVLKTNPRNVEACRMMAGLLEAEHTRETLAGALIWRERVLELDPGSFEDRLALAQAAIVNRDYPLATNTLAGASDSSKGTAAYHNVAGTAALMGGHPDEAEAHFRESIRIAPSDPIPQMNLAVVSLHRTNTLDMAEARISLQRIIMNSTNAALCSQARRELIADAMRFKDFPTAINLSQELAQSTNAIFTDKILRLDVLMKSQNSEFKPILALYQVEAATNVAKASELAQWQMINHRTAEALGWLQSLPGQTRTNLALEILAAECQFQLNDWRGLQASLVQQTWTDPVRGNFEFMRHAFVARSLRGQGLAEASTAEWVVAVKSASDQRNSMAQKISFKTLFDLAAAWKWDTEAEQVLWTVVNQFPEEKWAYPILRGALITWHRTKSLMQLLDIMFKRAPNDLTVKNDLATTAMLLGAQEVKPYDLAREVYQKEPKNPSYASTYAYSLYLQGKPADALRVMQQISPKDLQEPTVAGYYGLILKANGNKAEARAYLNRTSKAESLPEEQALFEQAEAGL